MIMPIDFEALKSQKDSKVFNPTIEKALSEPIPQEELDLANLEYETEKSEELKKNIEMAGNLTLKVVRPEVLKRLSKIDNALLDSSIQYIKDNDPDLYVSLEKWFKKGGRTSVPKNFKAIAVAQALLINCCVKESSLEHVLMAFPDFRKSNAIDGDFGINTYRATKALLDEYGYKTATGENASILGVDEFKFLLDIAQDNVEKVEQKAGTETTEVEVPDTEVESTIEVSEEVKEATEGNEGVPQGGVTETEATETETEPQLEKEKTLVVNSKYLDTDGKLKSVASVRIDQVVDLATAPDKLQITHNKETKNIVKGKVKINGKDVDTYVYEDKPSERVKIYDGDKLEETKVTETGKGDTETEIVDETGTNKTEVVDETGTNKTEVVDEIGTDKTEVVNETGTTETDILKGEKKEVKAETETLADASPVYEYEVDKFKEYHIAISARDEAKAIKLSTDKEKGEGLEGKLERMAENLSEKFELYLEALDNIGKTIKKIPNNIKYREVETNIVMDLLDDVGTMEKLVSNPIGKGIIRRKLREDYNYDIQGYATYKEYIEGTFKQISEKADEYTGSCNEVMAFYQSEDNKKKTKEFTKKGKKLENKRKKIMKRKEFMLKE